jgi:apolipoprotein N-acyltransferase
LTGTDGEPLGVPTAAAITGPGTPPAAQDPASGIWPPAARRTAATTEPAAATAADGAASTESTAATTGRTATTTERPAGPPESPAGPARPAVAEPAPPPGGAASPAGPRLALPWALLIAVVGGLALTAAFPPVGIWPLAPLGPALLVVALWRRGLRVSFVIGLLFGLALFVPLISWLINLAWYAWAALALAETVIFALLTVGQQVLLRLRAWPLAVAGWWVAAEALRDRWPYAFPWGRLAMSQAGAPTARWTAIGGAPLLSFLLALVGSTLAWLLLARSAGRDRAAPRPASPDPATPARGTGRRLVAPALAFAGAAGLALAGGLLPVDQVPPGTPTATVAAIQGNVPHARSLPGLLQETTVTANHASATERLAAEVRAGARPAPDLVIWPENSTSLDPRLYPPIYATIASAVAAIDRPVLVGEVLQNPQRNVGQLWTPGRGPGPIYVKRQLVPFGEYIPFRGLLSHITSLVALQPHNFTPGRRAVVFHVGRIRLGDVICYEVGFDPLVRSEVTAGANLLTVQTNDATFEVDGQVGESLQQLAMARIRAVESDRAVVVASTTGVSAVIAPDGALLAHTSTWHQAILDEKVPLVSTLTLADRIGQWPEYLITALTIAAFGWALAAAALRRRSRARS